MIADVVNSKKKIDLVLKNTTVTDLNFVPKHSPFHGADSQDHDRLSVECIPTDF